MRFNAAATAAGSIVCPHSASTLWTTAPARWRRAHAGSEYAVDADDHFIAGFDEVDDCGFHAGISGAGGGKGHFVRGAEDGSKHRAGFVHHAKIFGIEMADGRHRHGRQHAAAEHRWDRGREERGLGQRMRLVFGS